MLKKGSCLNGYTAKGRELQHYSLGLNRHKDGNLYDGRDEVVIEFQFIAFHVSAAVTSLIANNSGAVMMKTTVLLTPEEMVQATKQANETSGDYRPPGK